MIPTGLFSFAAKFTPFQSPQVPLQNVTSDTLSTIHLICHGVILPKRFSTFLIVSIAITLLVIALPLVPLGIVSANAAGESVVEWVWARHAKFADVADAVDRLLWPLFAGFCLVFVARRGIKSKVSGGRRSRGMSYLLLLAVSAQWIVAVQHSAASPHKELKPLWVLYDPGASGYYFEAAFKIPDTDQFLQGYEERMAEGDVLHVGTHPPGMFLLAKGCIKICEGSPLVRSLVNLLTTSSTTEAFRYVEQNAQLQRSLNESEIAGLQLLSLITLLFAVLTIVPLGLLASRLFAPSTAWIICCLWPTIPAISVFLPKSDLLFPALSLWLLLFSVVGCQAVWKAVAIGIPAAAVLLFTATLSLAILPTVAAIAVFLLLMTIRNPQEYGGPAAMLTVAVSVTLAILVFVIDQFFQCNLLAVFQANLRNHAGFYDQFQRTWWKWLLVNPIELAFAVGLPIFGLAAFSVRNLRVGLTASLPVDSSQQARVSSVNADVTRALLVGLAVTMCLLWLSGKNNGEAARLWCFMTPWILLLAGQEIERMLEVRSASDGQRVFTWLLISQLAVGLITVGRVNGFSF